MCVVAGPFLPSAGHRTKHLLMYIHCFILAQVENHLRLARTQGRNGPPCAHGVHNVQRNARCEKDSPFHSEQRASHREPWEGANPPPPFGRPKGGGGVHISESDINETWRGLRVFF